MSESGSYSESYDYSYTYSYSESEHSSDGENMNSRMWKQIASMPVDRLESSDDFKYMEKVILLVSRYAFTRDDPHMSRPEFTTRVGRLLQLVAAKCGQEITTLKKERGTVAAAVAEKEAFLQKKIDLQNSDLAKLRRTVSNSPATIADDREKQTDEVENDGKTAQDEEVRRLKTENDLLSAELRKLTRTNDELSQSLSARRQEQAQVYGDSDKLHLEHRHLVTRYRRLLEKSEKTEEALNEYRKSDHSKRHRDGSELDRLREKVKQLQEDNLTLVESRDRAEELCEKREAEALRDMTELRRLTKELVDEERNKVQQLREQFAKLQEEADAHVEELMQQHDDDVRTKDDEIALLRRQIEKGGTKHARRFDGEPNTHSSDYYSSSASSSRTAMSSDRSIESDERKSGRKSSNNRTGVVSTPAAQHALKAENGDLRAEVEELEIRIDALDEENRRLTNLVKNYESGDEGLLRIRQELNDATRTVEVLQDENTQLRERLNAMEGSLAFTAALQELCKRMGVTEDEIDSLKPQTVAAYSEIDTLKEELNVLKEEVEWLEKERRHWMNKVRLQPLMDTKLRFELGLSSEQLRQLDRLVDQMKSGNLVIEDEDASYKEKYFKVLEARRQDASHFNEYVKERIEDALKNAFEGDLNGDSQAVSALAALKDHIDVLTSAATGSGGNGDTGAGAVNGANTPAEMTRRQLRELLDSAHRQNEQLQLTTKDNDAAMGQLREKLSAAHAEYEVVARERDQYREAIFAAAGVKSSQQSDDEELEDEEGDVAADGDQLLQGVSLTARHSESKTSGRKRLLNLRANWGTISTTLREQLRVKDELVDSLSSRLSQQQEKLDAVNDEVVKHRNALEAEKRVQAELNDQLSALRELNESLESKNRELDRINHDLDHRVDDLVDGSKTKELLQKVVLLRRREAQLMTRLRRAIAAQEEAAASENKMRATMGHTLESIREAFEGNSTGFVLPPSSVAHGFEEEQLGYLHSSVMHLLQGKLFRADSRYLLHLQEVYRAMESNEEVTALRLRAKDDAKTMSALQNELDSLKVAQMEHQRRESTELPPAPPGVGPASPVRSPTGGATAASVASASRWESESTMWRQKYELCYKRLETKESEVTLLENELNAARQEIVDVKDHVQNLLSEGDPVSRMTSGTPKRARTSEGDDSSSASHTEDAAPGFVGKLARYEREVARLKSINLGLLQHTLDLQGATKSLQIDLEARDQELSLRKDANPSDVINEFVSAAVREHAALRRQSELALIQARRLKIQLAATEANYQVVANEATAYKLSAYRLYRRYVDEMVAVIDYVRCIQRANKGSLSPHRAEIMDRRFLRVSEELAETFRRSKLLTGDLSDQRSTVFALEQQLKLMKMTPGSPERQDYLEGSLRDAHTAAREAARQITECKEDCKFADGKVRRMETHIHQLTDELTRLEMLSMTQVSPLDEDLLKSLLHLKDTVYAKAEAPPLAISAPTGNVGDGHGIGSLYRPGLTGGMDDSDIAIREYKAAITKQRELSNACDELKRDVELKTQESQRLACVVAEQQSAIQRLEDGTALFQKQLDNERVKAESREDRLKRAHETQSAVSRRAMEHNTQCLREMISKKDAEITLLREQLNAERRRCMEQQLEEASRLERVHDNMFRENNAMVERFKDAINNVGNTILAIKPPLPGDDGVTDATSPSSSVYEQLRYLTSETVRLQKDLESARAANIVLESQLAQQLDRVRDRLPPSPSATAVSSVPGAPNFVSISPTFAGAQQQHPLLVSSPSDVAATFAAIQPSIQDNGQNTAAPAHGSVASNMDAFNGIIKGQSALLESLRQREAAVQGELALEKRHRAEAEAALQELRMRFIEKDGALHLVSQVSSNAESLAPVRELRAQLAYVEQELRTAKEQLEHERSAARQLQTDASAWKEHLDSLQLQVANQQVEVERAKQLSALNEGLQNDMNALKNQNDKLITASSVLKQNLMDEARRGGESSRQHQHEIALAQRMGAMQQESSEHMKALGARMRDIQKELNGRVVKEKEMLQKNEETQRLVYQLHQQLRAKDREIAEMKSQLRTRGSRAGEAAPERAVRAGSRSPPASSAGQPGRRGEKGTQVLATVPPEQQPNIREAATSTAAAVRDALASAASPQQLAGGDTVTALGAVSREASRMQRDNLQQISVLRSNVGRLESDLAEAREQLNAEREATRSLRRQLQSTKKAAEETEMRNAKELVVAHRQRAVAEAELTQKRIGDAAPSSKRERAAGTTAHEEKALVERLRQQITALEPRAAAADRLQKEIAELHATLGGITGDNSVEKRSVQAAYLATSADVRSHVRTVAGLETVIDGLRRQLNVDTPVKLNDLQHHNSELHTLVGRLLGDLATATHIPIDELRSKYAAVLPHAPGQKKTVAELESELLAKNNAILDLHFTTETLQLRVSRAERHLAEIMSVDTLQAKASLVRARSGQVQSLEAEVTNLQVLLSSLRSENAALRSQATNSARYPEVAREVTELRRREKDLQAQLTVLSERLSTGAARPVSLSGTTATTQSARLQERLLAAQASADSYHAELEALRISYDELQGRQHAAVTASADATPTPQEAVGLPRLDSGRGRAATDGVPPPLPPAPFDHTATSHRSPTPQEQRRPAHRREGVESDTSERGSHARMRHHHIHRRI